MRMLISVGKYVFITLIGVISSAQVPINDSVYANYVAGPKAGYKDFVTIGTNVYALTKGDSLIEWNLRKLDYRVVGINIKAIAKSNAGKVAIARSNGYIGFLEDRRKPRRIDSVSGKIFKIFMDKNDQLITYTDEAIWYKGQPYRPPTKSYLYRRMRATYSKLQRADVTFFDSSQRIWFVFDNGEWGGDASFFDLKSKKFFDGSSLYERYSDKYDAWNTNVADSTYYKAFPELVKFTEKDTLIKFPYNIYFMNVKGVAEDSEGNFLMSESLMHFFLEGNFTKIERSSFEDFYKITFLDDILKFTVIPSNSDSKFSSKNIEEYLGPVAFNKFNNTMYYYSSHGFFKLSPKDHSYMKEFIFRPWIGWSFGLKNSVGYQMNVEAFDFISENELVFLSPSAGIGYYNGTTVTYFK